MLKPDAGEGIWFLRSGWQAPAAPMITPAGMPLHSGKPFRMHDLQKQKKAPTSRQGFYPCQSAQKAGGVAAKGSLNRSSPKLGTVKVPAVEFSSNG